MRFRSLGSQSMRVMVTLVVGVLSFDLAASANAADSLSKRQGIDPRNVQTSELVKVMVDDSNDCFGKPHRPGECVAIARRELLRRRPIAELAEIANTAGDWEGLESARLLEDIGGPAADAALRHLAVDGQEGYAAYAAAMHFGRRCEVLMLDKLNRINFDYGISSAALAEAVDLFGRCRYYVAAPHMAEWIGAASLNLVDASCRSLKKMYKKGPQCSPSRDFSDKWMEWVRRETPKD